jgi:outer membrane protein assembly factor BamB
MVVMLALALGLQMLDVVSAFYTGPEPYGAMGWNYYPQNQINKDNVRYLEIKYIWRIPPLVATSYTDRLIGFIYGLGAEGSMAPPVISNGVVYIVTNHLSVYALDARNGRQLWVYHHKFNLSDAYKRPYIRPISTPGHLHGFNVIDNIVWLPGWACSIYGIDVSTGTLKVKLEYLCEHIEGNVHPLAGTGRYKVDIPHAFTVDTRNRVIIVELGGDSEGTWGGRATVLGIDYDAALRGELKIKWKVYLSPPLTGDKDWALRLRDRGWIQGFKASELPDEIFKWDWQRPDLADKWKGSPVAPSTGVSNVWGQLALNFEDGLVYIGTPQPGPDWNATYRPGPNLYTNAIVAVDVRTGEVKWWHQTWAHDVIDVDCNLNTIYAKVENRKLVLKACKSGLIVGLDALTGEALWYIDPAMPNPHPMKNIGPNWDELWKRYERGEIPLPIGDIARCPYRFCHPPNPFNATHMKVPHQFWPNENLAKTGGIHGRYFMETENAFDGRYFYAAVMSGPMEIIRIGPVESRGQTGRILVKNIYFTREMPVNTTIYKIDPLTGNIIWKYFKKDFYHRGGIIVSNGLLVVTWGDGTIEFIDTDTGKLVHSMMIGTPLLVQPQIGVDADGNAKIFIVYGGANHPILGEVGYGSTVTPGGLVVLGLPEKIPQPLVQTVTTTAMQTLVQTLVTTKVTEVTVEVVPVWVYALAAVAVIAVAAAATTALRARRR